MSTDGRTDHDPLLLRVDLNEGYFLGLFRYFPEISVFLGFFLEENAEISGKY